MASTHVPQPKEYWIETIAKGTQATFDWVQFVQGVVTSVTTGKDTPGFQGDMSWIGSIKALPHYTEKGISKESMLGEESRY